MLRRIIAASLISLIVMVGIVHSYEAISFSQGKTVKVLAAGEVLPTTGGGFVKHFTVIDNNGNTYAATTGRIAQWDKDAGSYIKTEILNLGGTK